MGKGKSSAVAKFVGLIVLAAGILAVVFLKKDRTPPGQESLIRPLKVLKAGEEVEALMGQYAGRVLAAQRVEMGFEVPGTLIEKLARNGEKVKKGQVLARLDPRDFQNDLAAAEASMVRARAQLERIRQAAAKNAVSKQDLDNAEAAFQIAQAEMRIKQKALNDTVLTATFDGLVADTYVDNFQNVQAKQAILSLQDVSSLEIEVSVPEQRMAASKRGDAGDFRHVAVFDYFPGREFETRIKEFSTEADPVTQTFTARFAFAAPEESVILPGMTATVLEYRRPGTAAQGVIALPLDVVPTASDGGYYVWKVSPADAAGGTAVVEKAAVKVGRVMDDRIEIVAGLQTGDLVAGAGVTLLRPGQIVRPMIADDK